MLEKYDFVIKEKEFYVLGVNWDGVDKSKEFIEGNCWESGFEDDSYIKSINCIEVGDFVALKSSYVKAKSLPFDNQGKKISVMMIKAVGVVEENPKDGKKLTIEYNHDFKEKEIYGFTYRHTVRKIKKEKWKDPIEWIFFNKKQTNFFMFPEEGQKVDINRTNITHPLNQILYGPPGTGKTYNTINKAIEIIENRKLTDEESKDRTKLKEKFASYKETEQIEFICHFSSLLL